MPIDLKRPRSADREPLLGPRGSPVQDSRELRRILALPRRAPIDLASETARAIVVRETARYSKNRQGLGPCRCKTIDPKVGCITEFLPIQAVALREARMAGGLLASIAVGGGKTFLNVQVLLALGVSSGLLIVPANLMKQLCRNYETFAEHFIVPKIIVHRPDGDWIRESYTDAPYLHVISHNGVSSPRQSDFIESINPDAVIIDEVDSFSDLTSSRTMRLLRFFREHGPDKKFVGSSGSLSDSGIDEFSHLACFALKEKSPCPIPADVVEDWGRCLNAVDNPCDPGALMELVGLEDEGDDDVARVRSAFRRRLEDTLGVILTASADVALPDGSGLVDIIVRERAAPRLPDIIVKALERCRRGKRPDSLAGSPQDDTFRTPLDQARCAREIACGFFYRWIFPRGESKALIDQWYLARSAWHAELRAKMLRGERFLDSANLCETAAKRYHEDLPKDPKRPVWASRMWPAWRDIADEVQPEPSQVRLDPFLVDDAAAWGREHLGIIWYDMVEFAEWLYDRHRVPVYGGGADAEDRISRLDGSVTIAASLSSHGRGRDGLQRLYARQLLTQCPASGRKWQQFLARLHRRGQASAIVITEAYLHTPEVRSSYDRANIRAEYASQTLKQRQKLIMGNAVD